jgi:hypothetical protein
MVEHKLWESGCTACTKMIAPSGHNGFGNACRNMFPTWNETAGIQVLIACAIPLPPPFLILRDDTKRKWRLQSRKRFVCCSLRSMFSGPSGDNFRVIPHLPATLGVGNSRFRQEGACVKGRVRDVRVWNEWESFHRSPTKSVRHASRELEMSTMTVWKCCERDWKWSPIVFTWCSFFNQR